MAYHHMGTFVIKEEVSEESLDEMFQKVEELFATVDSATNVMVGRNLNPSAKYRMFGICATFPNQDAWLAFSGNPIYGEMADVVFPNITEYRYLQLEA